jgi:molybdate transport system ATP-binding protein
VRDELDLPILYITHDPDEALLVGEVVVVLDAGRVVASGPPRDVLWSRSVLPLSEALGIENVFDGRVAEAATEPQVVLPSGLRLHLPFPAAAGETVRIGLRAEDVVLSAEPPGRISARNVFPARVVACDDHDADVYVRLEVPADAAGEELVAKITPSAEAHLELAPGREVYAIVKAQALRRLG